MISKLLKSNHHRGMIQITPPLTELLFTSDFISINVFLNDSTYHFIKEWKLNLIQSHAYLINISRWAVIEESALIKSLRIGKFAGIAIDVFEEEPAPSSNNWV